MHHKGKSRMSDFEKISIYVPKYVRAVLDSDARFFEILKKDGVTINRNLFLRMLILGYYNTYVSECKAAKRRIRKELDNTALPDSEKEELSWQILSHAFLPDAPKKRGVSSVRISLKPTRDIEKILVRVLNGGSGSSISQFFRGMLISYASKPLYERERIIFHEKYLYIEEACQKHACVSFYLKRNPQMLHHAVAYAVAYSQEEMANYFLCQEKNSITGELQAETYRFCRVEGFSAEPYSQIIDDSVRENLQYMVLHGPQYARNETTDIVVKLNETGVELYSRIYFGRPDCDRMESRKDGTYCHFSCSQNQAFLYFRRFSDGSAQVLEPQSLREKMIEFHKNALKPYEESGT